MTHRYTPTPPPRPILAEQLDLLGGPSVALEIRQRPVSLSKLGRYFRADTYADL